MRFLSTILSMGVLAAALVLPGAALARSEARGQRITVSAVLPAELGARPTPLREVAVPGVGRVVLTASRTGTALKLRAVGPDGTVLGTTETVVGLSKCSIHVRTPSGLEEIEISWESSSTSKSSAASSATSSQPTE